MTQQNNMPARRVASQGALARSPREMVTARMEQMIKSLPMSGNMAVKRFQQAALAIAGNPGLADCTGDSVVKSVYVCARLGLIPDPVLKQVYIVPFRNHGKKEAQVVIGYGGLIELARRAEPALMIQTGIVYENDDYTLVEGYPVIFKVTKRWWEKGMDSPGRLRFAWCVSKMPGTEYPNITVVPRQEGEMLAAKAKAGNAPGKPWYDYFDAMCMKTAVRKASKLWSLSPEKEDTSRFREALDRDESEDDGAEVPSIGDDILDGMEGEAGASLPPEGERSVGNLDGRYDANNTDTQASPPPPPPPPPAPKKAPAPKAAPVKKSSTKEERSELLKELKRDIEVKLLSAGHNYSDDKAGQIVAAMSGNDDFRDAIAKANEEQIRNWIGSVKAATEADINQIIGPPMTQPDELAQEEAPPAEPEAVAVPNDPEPEPVSDEQANVDPDYREPPTAGPDVLLEGLAAVWCGTRPNLSNDDAKKAVVKLIRFRHNKLIEDLKPEERKALAEAIRSGVGLNYALFEPRPSTPGPAKK